MFVLILCIVVILSVYIYLSRRNNKLYPRNYTRKTIKYNLVNPVNKKEYTSYLCNVNTEKCKENEVLNPCCVSKMLEMCNDLFRIFKENKLDIWLAYGSLLGLKRHSGIIPWDNDLDTLTTANSEEIEKIRPELEKIGYVLKRTKGNQKGTYPPAYDYYTMFYSKRNDVHVDIGMVVKNISSQGEVLIDAPIISHKDIINDMQRYKQWIVKYEDVFPLKTDRFYNITVNIPNKTKKILKGEYSKDCLRVAYLGSDHLKLKRDDEIKEFSPAMPIISSSSGHKPRCNIRECYIISMRGYHDRLHRIMSDLNNHKLNGSLIEAIPADKIGHIKDKIYKYKNYRMKDGEIACYLSHMKAISKIAGKDNDGHYLVLEDDTFLLPSFDETLDRLEMEIRTIPEDPSIIFFGGCFGDSIPEMKSINKDGILNIAGLFTGTWAYALRPSDAKYLLKQLLPISYPMDLVLTIPNKIFPSKTSYDHRFEGKLMKYVISTGRYYDNNRFGIIGESSTEWNQSTSSKI